MCIRDRIQKGETLLSENTTLQGQLRIGASDTICRYFLIPYLQRFHKEHPDVRIRVTNPVSYTHLDVYKRQSICLS